MASLVIELTNRCNLKCLHCYTQRHNADGNLKLDSLEKILKEAGSLGFENLSFTGGEPTMHPGFEQILAMICGAGYRYGFVSNGWNFTDVYVKVLNFREQLNGITFSLDGAEEETHDRMRGKGSFRRVMSAVSICVARDIPFTFNTLITSNNSHQLAGIVDIAGKLGSQAVRFGQLIPTLNTIRKKLVLSHAEQNAVSNSILELEKNCELPVFLAPGYYTKNLFPCNPLQMEEMNIDWRGNVTMCCHLSGYGDGKGDGDVLGNLDEISFSEAYERLVLLNRKFRREKHEHFAGEDTGDEDYFPCIYCLHYFNKKIPFKNADRYI